MIGGADGPLERRDPVQVPAFVAEESGTRDQARTLVLGRRLHRPRRATPSSAAPAPASATPNSPRQAVSNEPARQGRRQPRRGLRRRPGRRSSAASRSATSSYGTGAPRQMSRVLDSTPGLSRLSQQDGSALWRVDRQVSRAAIVPASGVRRPAQPVAAGPVEVAHHDPGRLRPAACCGSPTPPTEAGRPRSTASPLDPDHRRRLGPGLRTARRRRPAGPHLRDPDRPHRLALAAGRARRRPRRPGPAGPPPGRRRRPARGRARDPRPGQPTGEGRRARRLRAQAEADAARTGRRPGRVPRRHRLLLRRRPRPRSRSSSRTATNGTPPPTRAPSTTATAPTSTSRRPAVPAGHLRPGVPGGPVPERPVRPVRVRRPRRSTTAYDQTYTQGYDPAYDPAQPQRPHPHSHTRRMSTPTGASSEPHHHLPDRRLDRARRRHRLRLAQRTGRVGRRARPRPPPSCPWSAPACSARRPAPPTSRRRRTRPSRPSTEGDQELTARPNWPPADRGEDAAGRKEARQGEKAQGEGGGHQARPHPQGARQARHGRHLGSVTRPRSSAPPTGRSRPAGPSSRPPRSPRAPAAACWASTAPSRTPTSGSRARAPPPTARTTST